MSLNIFEAKQMVGKCFQSDMNNPDEMRATVLNVIKNGGGYTVLFQHKELEMDPVYTSLGNFKKRYPYQLKGQP